MAKNNKEKIFILCYKTPHHEKLHKFIKEELGINDKRKYLHWATYLPNFYTLSSLEDTYWDVNKLTNAISKYMDDNIIFIIFEVQNSPVQGSMPKKYWDYWKDSQDLTSTFENHRRSKKLKKITDYIKKKERLKQKEEELKRKKIELEKELSLKKKEEELLEEERRLKEIEDKLKNKDSSNDNDNKTKKRRFRFWI